MNLATELRNHAIQLRTMIDEYPDEQGIEITAYLLRRSIRLLEAAAKAAGETA